MRSVVETRGRGTYHGDGGDNFNNRQGGGGGRDSKEYAACIEQIFSQAKKVDAIIDFCAYDIQDAQSSLRGIDIKKLSQYIYIGSDSSYESASEYHIQG